MSSSSRLLTFIPQDHPDVSNLTSQVSRLIPTSIISPDFQSVKINRGKKGPFRMYFS
jgi:hypothetical protein